jgi:hypothetical protein
VGEFIPSDWRERAKRIREGKEPHEEKRGLFSFLKKITNKGGEEKSEKSEEKVTPAVSLPENKTNGPLSFVSTAQEKQPKTNDSSKRASAGPADLTAKPETEAQPKKRAASSPPKKKIVVNQKIKADDKEEKLKEELKKINENFI